MSTGKIIDAHNAELLRGLIPADNELIEGRGIIDPKDENFYKPLNEFKNG